jgi:phosphonate transport system substrate-binding protein
MRARLKIYLFLGVLIILGACTSNDDEDYQPKYTTTPPEALPVYLFGVHPLHNPSRLFEVYQPLMDYLEQHIEGAHFKLEASRNYAAYNEKLFSGYSHFALPNPYQTVTATEHGYHIFGKMGNDEDFRGIILVRRDSGIESVADLKGKAVSYPAPTALAATMLPQWYFHQHGLDVMQDLDNRYVGSQESAIMNVYLGHTRAGATWPPPWRAFAKERPEVAAALEVKWQTESLPNNGLVVRHDVPAEIVAQVSVLLFNLHQHAQGQALLAPMELDYFEAADMKTYDPVRAFLARFEQEIRGI